MYCHCVTCPVAGYSAAETYNPFRSMVGSDKHNKLHVLTLHCPFSLFVHLDIKCIMYKGHLESS